jgi:parallel beta-helix repeat protein
VYNGTYVENVVVYKSINLVGEEKNNTIIDGSNKKSVVKITHIDITVNGFTIQNSGNERWNYSGIEIIYYRGYNNILNCNIKSNSYGVLLSVTERCNISNNNIFSNYCGIKGSGIRMVGDCYKNIISSNLISDCKYGILGDYGFNYCTVINNIITKNWIGLEYCAAKENVCTRNTFSDNVFGIIAFQCKTNITRNNFIRNIIPSQHLSYAVLNAPGGKILWNENYWNRARLLPYPIFGRWGSTRLCLLPSSPQYDMNPAKKPYEI